MAFERSNGPVLALVRDLIFSSRIAAAAKHAGVEVRIIRDPAKLDAEPAARLLLVDLNLPGAIDAAAQWRAATSGTAVGFVSHVDTETISRAREMGIEQMMARSGFVQSLPDLLASNATDGIEGSAQ